MECKKSSTNVSQDMVNNSILMLWHVGKRMYSSSNVCMNRLDLTQHVNGVQQMADGFTEADVDTKQL